MADERLALLHSWQRYYHMEPRNDSRLTQLFVAGELSMEADQVARELMCTDFVYKNTLYGEVIEDFLREVASMLRTRYPGLSWTSTWTIVRFYGPTALKLMSLSAAGLRMPEHLPEPPSM